MLNKLTWKHYWAIILVLLVIIGLQYRSALIQKEQHTAELFSRSRGSIAEHFSSLQTLNQLSTDILEEDALKEDLETMFSLAMQLDIAKRSYESHMWVIRSAIYSDVYFIFQEYSNILRAYTLGNLLDKPHIDKVDYDLFIDVLTDIHVFSEWAYHAMYDDDGRMTEQGIAFYDELTIYTEQDMREHVLSKLMVIPELP